MSHASIALNGFDLEPESLAAIARQGSGVEPTAAALAAMARSRDVVERHLAEDRPVYGLTTGLGSRVVNRLPREVLAEFSRLTILGRSHSVGPRLAPDMVRALMAVRLNGLLAGGSGAAPAVAEALAALINGDLKPVIPGVGSIGAGDLCVLAQLGLALIGDPGAEIEIAGERRAATEALAQAGLKPLILGPKDGLAICNASALSAARAALALVDAEAVYETAQLAAALTMEGFRANLSPLDPRAAAARPAPGQEAAAAGLRRLLAEGDLTRPGAARRVQDPLSLRCASQVHGSLRAALDFARPAVLAELNGSADNPLVLAESGEIISTGNFQTSALALAMETLSQALAQVAALSVSRACRLLIERLSGLPANLSPHGPTRSGFAPLFKVAEALLQEVRHLAQPAPCDLRWGADGVEDDLTNAPLAARKVADATGHMNLLLACELVAASQAVELAQVERMGRGTAVALRIVRELVPPLDEDRPLGRDVERVSEQALANGRLLQEVRVALE